jgi:hypothetical protein
MQSIRKFNNNLDEVHTFIDNCLIYDYATKDRDGFYLDVDQIPEHDFSNFLEILMQHDTNVRDLVRYHMQKMIDERLPEVYI